MRPVRVALAVVVLALGASAEPAGAQREIRVPGRPVVVLDAELPATHLFGERVHGTLTVAVNPTLADPESLRVDARFPPYRIVEVAAGRTGEEPGGRVILRYSYLLECLDADCLPSDDAIEFPNARVDYRVSGASEAEPLAVEWPEVAVVSRLSEQDLEQPQFRLSAPASEAGDTSMVPAALAAAALVALAGGVVLAWLLARAAPRPAPLVISPQEASPLAAAFAVLEQPAGRSAEERRAALDVLARTLEGSGRHELAARARRLAWFSAPPAPGAVEDLLAAVRREAA